MSGGYLSDPAQYVGILSGGPCVFVICIVSCLSLSRFLRCTHTCVSLWMIDDRCTSNVTIRFISFSFSFSTAFGYGLLSTMLPTQQPIKGFLPRIFFLIFFLIGSFIS